uniref:Coiled-coil domain containing 66 n=1 Tax=Sphenodon punctatus TaxID=8508 RepID=A0A8D0GD91_SPHPU
LSCRDGLKLETEILNGKPRLMLASYGNDFCMGNKTKILNHPLKTKQTCHVLKSSQNTSEKHEHILIKPRIGSRLSPRRGDKSHMMLSSNKGSSKESSNDSHAIIIQKDGTTAKHGIQNPETSIKNPVDLCSKSSKITWTGSVSWFMYIIYNPYIYLNEIEPENLHSKVLFLTGLKLSISNFFKTKLTDFQNKNLLFSLLFSKNSWKPADIFSTLGERERDKNLLEAKKSQWKKELDEQVALKKKLKDALESETKLHPWGKTDSDKTCSEKLHTADQAKEATPVEHPFSDVKREQHKKWLEELNKQKEAAKLRKMEEKHNLSKAEEHDRWTMHFDSLKRHANSHPQPPLNTTYKKQPEVLCLSPEHEDLTAFIQPFTPTALGHLMPSEVESLGKAVENTTLEPSQKASFLRSMTALLDPAQIEERDRRRQKQLEHQKAIMAQVEEKRRKKQLEEEQRKREEQEEEHRLARERELMQRQFEDDLLKQKQKEEIMTLKTNELYQTMQRAQELAHRLKQEQRIRELAQKGHDISKLQKNLGGDAVHASYSTASQSLSNVSHDHCLDELSSKVIQDLNMIVSPRKDTAVQTDNLNTETCTEASRDRRTGNCTSPDISIEYKGEFNSKTCKKELQYADKKKISEKENNGSYSNVYEQFARKEKQTKPMERHGKRPEWNINQPGKRYIPASERYSRRQQKQREEKKIRRQMELLQLVERNTPGNLSQNRGISPERCSSPHPETGVTSKGVRVGGIVLEWFHSFLTERTQPESPPVPAVKNRLHQIQQKQINTSNLEVHNDNSCKEKNTSADKQQREPSPAAEPGRPPSAHFIPYVRTNEVYYLDPDAPMTRPSTHDPQYRHFNESYNAPRQIFSSDHVRDPLLNPNVMRDRQQAILKGLSELRQVLHLLNP